MVTTNGVDNDRPVILCVDDEPQVVEGLSLHLARRYTMKSAYSGAAGLELLKKSKTDVAVIVTDMRMPGMDGASFLRAAQELQPDATRLLLTGETDLETAIRAVNEGNIFRFLKKPCAPAVFVAQIDAALRQHRLVTAERVLLEKTLHGSIKALIDVLSLTNPLSFGRANRIKHLVTELSKKLGMKEVWQVEMAAMLSQLGTIVVPVEALEKGYFGQVLTAAEQEVVARIPMVTDQILSAIPRLEVVREILLTASKPPVLKQLPTDATRALVKQASDILRLANDYDVLEAQGQNTTSALSILKSRIEVHSPELVGALAEIAGTGLLKNGVREFPLTALRVGMIVSDDIKRTNGTLVVARGYEMTESFLERIRNFPPGSIREPIRAIAKFS